MAALSISPSEYWEGNDGTWSTFNVNIGTRLQQMRVLPATSQSAIFVVIQQGCPSPPDPANCPSLRGEIFDPDPSKDVSWSPQHNPDGDPYYVLPFASETSLPNYTANGEVGFDTLTLDWSGEHEPKEPLQGQLIAGYAAPNPWLGMLGLSGRPSHIFNSSSSQDSPLETLLRNKTISELSWGYTAGAHYQSPPVFGSLTFGGYDEARVDMNSALTVPFGSDSTRDLLVAITVITISGVSTTTVSGLPIYALIDSVVPEIWLPIEACSAFESAFGLVWNETFQIYFVNDTQHADLVAQNPSVTFFLGATSSATNGTRITFPYAAFDLSVQFPLAGIQDNTTSLRYFPLKRAANDTQYYLGRTFFQQAYVMADYNMSQFTVAPALFPSDSSSTNLITATPPSHHNGLSGGAIAGIVVGAVVAVALIAGLLLWWLWWRPRQQCKRQKRESQRRESEPVRYASFDNTTIAGDTDVPEMERMEHFKPPLSPPPEEENFLKPELDATFTAVRPTGQQTERHELDAGSVRPAHHRELSESSAGSGVSPMAETRISSMLGEPSPPIGERSPRALSSESSSPPLSGRRYERHHSAGSPHGLFELQETHQDRD